MTTAAAGHRSHVRSPVDVLRLIVALITIGVGIFAALTFDRAFLGLRDDGDDVLNTLPDWAADVPAAILAAGLVFGILATTVWALATRRYRRLSFLVGAALLAGALSALIGIGLDDLIDSDVREAFLVDGLLVDDVLLRPTVSDNGVDRVIPGDPLFAAAVAVLGIASSWLPRRLSRRLAFGLVGYAALSTLTAAVPALSLLTDAGVGLAVAAAIHLIGRRHDLAPDQGEITEALASIGLPLKELDALEVDARGSAPWIGTTADGRAVFIKSLGRDERSADLLFRSYRWLRIRRSGDHRPFDSLRRAVEHEALVSLQACALGVQTPPLLGVSDAGLDGVVLVYEAVDGRSADLLDDMSDDMLERIWAMVALLHRHRIAHRDLRVANLLIDTDGDPWLIDFGFAELAADDQLLSTDTAELLASTTAVVGPARAVAAARTSISDVELTAATPWLQPLSLSGATSTAIGGAKGLVPLHDEIAAACECEPEEPVSLERVSLKTVFVIATLALSVWFLLPQVASIGTLWDQVKGASLWWASAAVLLSVLTYVGATVSLIGAVPAPVRFRGAFAAQLASSFANRVTPAKVGGVATNVRYFQRQGIPVPVAVSAVGMNGLAGLVVHITLTLVFLGLAGSGNAETPIGLPSPILLISILLGVLAATGAGFTVPWGRNLYRSKIRPQLAAGWQAAREISTRPAKLTALFGGSLLITLAYLATMVASLYAFGSTASLPLVALLFLTGSAVASAAPTPGGLGATEAALIAALSTVESAAIVVPAVFLYRLATFWMPILPGWLFLTALQRSGDL